ncbi:nuclear transport factor 2 family protein [Phytomonospora sp. NPDC050363]|uniref:nuclear transport factor 2 family protein n=1 Tax=Phytomonospora sp. NPDC050363 TaxID=3155642 RepID=UPI003402CA72
MSNTRETVENFLARLGKWDIDGVLNLVADPVDMAVHGSPLVPWLGRRRSHIQVAEFFNLIHNLCTPERFEVEKVLVDGDEAVVLGEFAHLVNETGKTFASTFALRLTVIGGRITRYHMHEDSYAVHLAFGGDGEPGV